MRVPARGRQRWRALAFAAVPGALLVTTTVQASPPEPPEQPVVLPDAAVTKAPNLVPDAPPADVADGAQAIENSYIVVMAADPVVAYDGGEPGLAPTAVDEAADLDTAAPAVEAYVNHLETEQQEVLAATGIDPAVQGDSYTYAINGFEAAITATQAEALRRQPGVATVVPNTFHELQTDNSPKFLGLSAPNGPWDAGLTGEDVVVGVIDSGIWPEHASFADDGSYSELEGFTDLPCEFGDTAYNPADAPFECNNKLLGAYDLRDGYKDAVGPELYNSARDYDGHGTHTASTAAGNRDVAASVLGVDRGLVSGIAPRARVIAYSVCGALGCVESDLVAAIEQAVTDGVDVINYSIGSSAPTVTGADDIAYLFAADANVWVAASNGNTGPNPATTGSPASAPWVTSVGASTQDRTFSSTARLGNGQLAIGASITASSGGTKPLVDAATLGNPLCQEIPGPNFTQPVAGKIVLCLRGGNARVDKSRIVGLANGAGMILYNPNDVQALVTDNHWVPSVHVNFTTGKAIKAYIASAGAGATASLTAGKKVRAQGSVMADFSSRGQNRAAPDIIKPDVTAPGVNILAGASPTPYDPAGTGAPGQLFQAISGTSMSSPHVAGLFALLRQAHPDWSAAMAKSAVMTTARQDVTKEDASTPADPFDMGAGHVDPAGRPTRGGSMFSPGLVYDVGLFDYYGFLCDAAPSVFPDPDATCDALEGGGYATTAANLNLASIGDASFVGSTTVQRTVTSVNGSTRRYTVDIEDPPGYEVSVEPASIRLAPGESATYEVTISRTDAAFDEWSFGALTWRSGTYEVRSPIAVQSSNFAAPEVVVGEGVEGTVTVPVRFGYTGAYSAAAHGPVPVTRTPGTVAQDPDQEFDPADPAGTTAVPLELTGSAFLRIALDTADLTPPNAPIDIDLYLYDEAGNEVASSGAGSTRELIEVVVPPDGTYTLYVHGWSVGPTPVGFSLRSWSVPLEPGTGALTIDSAPTSAVTGADGEVVASWSGLEAGESYLGAISHAGEGDELLGLTLVEIET